MPGIIDRYILRETAESWLAVSAVLLLILIGNSFLLIFRQVSGGAIPPDAIAPFLVTHTVMFLVGIVPFSLYLGILIGMGRLYRDSEMAAMAACGIGGWGIFRPALLLAVPALAIVALLTFVVTPWAAQLEQRAKTEIANRSELSGVEPGRFNESRDGSTVLFAARIEQPDRSMNEVFVHGPDPRGGNALETARKASQVRQYERSYIVLSDGVRYVGRPGDADYTIIEFAEHGVPVPTPPPTEARLRRAGLSIEDLLNSSHVKDLAELHWRVALLTSVPLLAFVAVPLSFTAPRKGRYGRLALAILVYVPYWNLLLIGKSWIRDEVVPASLGLWWAHLPVLVLALIMIVRQGGGASRLFART